MLGEEHAYTLGSIVNLGHVLQAQGKLSEAEPVLREALERSRRVLGEEHVTTLASVYSLGSLFVAQGNHAEAARLLVPTVASARKALTGANPRGLASFLMHLGKARTGLGELAAAETDLLEAQPLFVKTRGPQHRDTRACTQAVVDLYTAWFAVEADKGYDAKAAEWKRKLDELGAPANRE